MSTGGKVLVVLVTILTLVWIGLMSMVARLNSNYGEAVQNGAKALLDLENQVKESTVKLQKLEDDVVTSHLVADDSRNLLRIQLQDQQTTLAELNENLDRMNGLFNSLIQSRQKTSANITIRQDETAKDQDKLMVTMAKSEDAKKRNADLLAKLQDLRNKFVELSNSNRELFNQIGSSEKIRDVSPGSALITGR
jgi:transcriptional regulator of heat shock response